MAHTRAVAFAVSMLAAAACNDDLVAPETSLPADFVISHHRILGGAPFGVVVPANGSAWVGQSTGGTIQRVAVSSGAFIGTSFSSGGSTPVQLARNASGTRVFVANQFGGVTSFNSATQAPVRTINLSGDEYGIIGGPTGDIVYVGMTNGDIHKLDFASGGTGVVMSRDNLPDAAGYHFVWNQDFSLLYASARQDGPQGGQVYVLNPTTLATIHILETGHLPQGIALSADGNRLYVATQEVFTPAPNVGTVQVWDVSNVAGEEASWIDTFDTGCEGYGLLRTPDDDHLYVGCVFDGKVIVLDLPSGDVIETMNVGGRPREMAYDPGTKSVVVPNEDGWVDILDIATQPLTGAPFGVAIPSNGTAWVGQSTGGTIQRFDALTGVPIGSAFSSGGSTPVQLAGSADGSRVFVANMTGGVKSFNAANPQDVVSRSVPGQPYGIIGAPSGNNIAYVGTTDGAIHKVNFATGGGVETKPAPPTGAAAGYHFAWNQNFTRLYASARQAVGGSAQGEVYVLDANLNTIRTIVTGERPQGIAFSADGTKLYVAMQEVASNAPNAGTVKVWDVTNVEIENPPLTDIFDTNCEGYGLLRTPDDDQLYVGCIFDGKVIVLDLPSGDPIKTYSVGGRPREMAYDPGRERVVVPNEHGWVDFLATAAPLSGTPDPTLLPEATLYQGPLTAAYNALNVPGLAAGSSYLDPTTGVKIYKLTSGTFPTSSSYWGHDYAEGGDEVSLPYNGNTRAVLVRGNGFWLLDFTPGVGVGNARQLTGSLAPWLDLAFTFSSNPATPYYAYVSNGNSVQRIDIRTMTAVPGNGWPVNNESNAGWLHQSEGDAFFTWVRGTVVVGYEPSTGTLRTQTVSNPDVDQPQINRNSSVRQVAINTEGEEGLKLWDFTQNLITCTAPGTAGGGPQFNHMGALRDRWIGLNWNTPAPHNYHQYLPDCSSQNLGSPASANDYYANGTWNQHPASLDDQWALFSTQGGLVPPGCATLPCGYLAPGGMVYVTASGQRRLLGHPYNTSTTYSKYSFVKQSSDGRYVLFTSNMNGADGSRTDVFLVEVPVR